MKNKKRTIFLIFALFWSLLVWWLLVQPNENLPSLVMIHIRGSDKLLHMSAFALLSYLWLRVIRSGRKAKITIVLLIITFGAFCEYKQILIVGRTGSIADQIANIIGTIIGGILAMRSGKKKN